MSKEFTYNNKIYDANKDSKQPFYYYYRSESEKQQLHNQLCDNMRLFYDTVCLYEKNKDNPNCPDLLEYLNHICK